MTLVEASCWEITDHEENRSAGAVFNPYPGKRLFHINAEFEYTWLADVDKDDGGESIEFDDDEVPHVIRHVHVGFYLERAPLMGNRSSAASILKQFVLSYVALPKEDHCSAARAILSEVGSVCQGDEREIISLGLQVQCYLDSRRKVDEVKNAATRIFHSKGLRHVRVAARSQRTCSICLEPMKKAGTAVVETSCAHVFHQHCISSWLANSAACPMCRCTSVSTVCDDNKFRVCIS